MTHQATLFLADEAATQSLGAALGQALLPGMNVRLVGELGAGKTTLVRALLKSLGYTGPVKSPSYSLLESYALSAGLFHHFDFYRFESPEEFLEAGLDEYFGQDAVCLVEWPEKAAAYLPPADLTLELIHQPQGRTARLIAGNKRGEQCLIGLRKMVST